MKKRPDSSEKNASTRGGLPHAPAPSLTKDEFEGLLAAVLCKAMPSTDIGITHRNNYRGTPVLIQKDAARLLGWTESKLNRCLSNVENRFWKEELILERVDPYKEQIGEYLENRELTSDLRSQAELKSVEIIVVKSPMLRAKRTAKYKVSADEYDNSMIAMAGSAADWLVARGLQVKDGNEFVIGLSWGKVVREIVNTIGNGRWKKREINRIIVTPLQGEPMGRSLRESSATTLAEDLGHHLNPDGSLRPSLAGVPAAITCPESRRHFRELAWYCEVFGEKGVARRADLIITGAGGPEQGQDPMHQYLASIRRSMKRRDNREWQDLIYGDIAGVVFPIDDEEANLFSQQASDCWMGVQKEMLVSCTEKRSPGVCVATFGREKAPVLAAALREKCIGTLIIDEDAALELLQQLGANMTKHLALLSQRKE